MNTFSGILVVALVPSLIGCASTSTARNEPQTAADAPSHEHESHAHGDVSMAGICPMRVPGTGVVPADVDGGIGLSFTTSTGDVVELRQRVRRMAEMHNQRGGHMMMGGHGEAEGGAEHQHGAQAGATHEGAGRGGMMMGAGMMMPPATASVEDVEGGARVILRPKDPAELAALQEHVRMKAQRMAGGECPMMSPGSGSEDPAPSNPTAPDHDTHHPEK